MRRDAATSLRLSIPTARSGCERETVWCCSCPSRELTARERGDVSAGEVGGMCIDRGEEGEWSGESAPLRGDAGAIMDGWTAGAHCDRERERITQSVARQRRAPGGLWRMRPLGAEG